MPDESSKLQQREPALKVAQQGIKADKINNNLVKDNLELAVDETTAKISTPDKKIDDKWAAIFIKAPEIARHTVTLLLSLLSLWIIHLTIKYLFDDPKFFGVIPLQWVVDVGDIAMFIKFIWHIVRDFNR